MGLLTTAAVWEQLPIGYAGAVGVLFAAGDVPLRAGEPFEGGVLLGAGERYATPPTQRSRALP
jgi:hypothetical protein